MLKSKPILLFSLIFIAVYLLLALPWNRLSTRYAEFYKNQAQRYFSKIGESGYLLFERNDPTSTVLTITQINADIVNKGGQTDAVKHEIDTKVLAYLPSSFMIALFLATPITFKKRLLWLCFGLLILHIILMASLYVIIIYNYAHAPSLKMFLPQQTGWNMIDMLECLVNRVTGQYSFIVICIWGCLISLFERRCLAQLKNSLVQPKAESAPV